MPARFHEDCEDENEDVTAPKRKDTLSMNQPFLAMIARAGQQSQTDLTATVEEDSGDSDGGSPQRAPVYGFDGASRLSRISKSNIFQRPSREPDRNTLTKHRRGLSDHKLIQSLPRLKMPSRKTNQAETQVAQDMSSSQILAPPEPHVNDSGGHSQDEVTVASKPKGKGRTSNDEISVERRRASDRRNRDGSSTSAGKGKAPGTLAERLQQIFEFESLEEVISGEEDDSKPTQLLTPAEYPCWLLQSILLQGNMYITQKHICFHAYIPKKHVRCSILSSERCRC